MKLSGLTALVPAALVLAVVAAGPAAAQAPSGERADAMKKACKGDFQRFCSGVMPGGGRIIACLQSHSAELAPDCAKALGK